MQLSIFGGLPATGFTKMATSANRTSLLLKAFKHAVVHLEEREGPLGGDRMPWWNAALGKGARKHRGHGHGHIKHHDKHDDEVRTSPRCLSWFRSTVIRRLRHRKKLASVRHDALCTQRGYLLRVCGLWRQYSSFLRDGSYYVCSEGLCR